VVVSEDVARDVETAAALADRIQTEETAMLRGVSAPVRFVRIEGFREALPAATPRLRGAGHG
jgi:hypothetical protein